mgnify:CR=1 FL=1
MAGGEGCAGRSSFVKTRPGDGSGDGEAVLGRAGRPLLPGRLGQGSRTW